MLGCREDQLGHSFEPATLDCFYRGKSFKLEGVLGKGGFATVFEASCGEQIIAIKKATKARLASTQIHNDQLEHMTRELEMLRRLSEVNCLTQTPSTIASSSNCPLDSTKTNSSTLTLATISSSSSSPASKGYFPVLMFDNWVCDEKQPFLPLLPVGVPLAQRASQVKMSDRVNEGQRLRQHLKESLDAALSLGYCHCDLRPDNVVYVPGREVFMIIDWGLGCMAGSSFHGYTGGLPFFHDDIVEVSNINKDKLKTIAYQPEFDAASANYVVYAFELGNRHLAVPWAQFAGMRLVMMRQEAMQGKRINDVTALADEHNTVASSEGLQSLEKPKSDS